MTDVANGKQGFTVFHADINALSSVLTAEQMGRLFVALSRYSECGETEVADDLKGVFALLTPKIDQQNSKYAETCARNRTNRTSRDQSSPVVTSGDQSLRAVSSRPQQEQEQELKQEQEHNRILTDADGGEAANAHACARETQDAHDTDDVVVAKNATTAQKPKKAKKPTDTALIAEAIKDYADGDAELEGLLNDWMANRKAKRSPATIRAVQINLDKLDAMAQESGMTVKAYLREVIARGWAAFFVIKDGGGGYRASPRQQQPQSTADYYLQLMQEME